MSYSPPLSTKKLENLEKLFNFFCLSIKSEYEFLFSVDLGNSFFFNLLSPNNFMQPLVSQMIYNIR